MSEVLYSDVKFKNPKGINAQADASTSNDSAYSEVRFSRAQGNDPSQDTTDDSASQPVGSKGGSKVASGRCDAVKVGLGLLCALLLAAVIALTVLYLQNKDLQKNHTDTDKQTQEAIRKNLTDSIKELRSCQAKQFSCPEHIQPPKGPTCNKPCATGWESYGGKCYWFSSDKHTWDESKNDCTRKGANLVKIDSTDEQKFLQGKLKDRMAEPEDKFWIGLTDSKIEGQWVWADGSPLTPTARFWSTGEPDNWTGSEKEHPEGENCGRMGEKYGSKSPWFDAFCDKPQRFICEKQRDTGSLESKCV